MECRPVFETAVESKVYIAQGINSLPASVYRTFTPSDKLRYHPLCDDFGPFNISNVFAFIELLDKELELFPNLKIVYCIESGQREMANALFLIGAYMILKCNMSSQAVIDRFCWADDRCVEPFRDATYSTPNFHLTLQDCWRGLEKGKSKGWVQLPTEIPGVWGRIDKCEYDQYDDPVNADMHEIVPGKFFAFRGPKDLQNGRTYLDDNRGLRHFSPEYYAEIFKALGVSTIIRLNEPEYDSEAFTIHGIDHYNLEFEDCTAPPHRIVQAFFRITDAAPGAVAVHCKAGLGRTGTLISLALMRHHAFSAREAIGWARLMRPGSVIGQQQQYLCEVERCVAAARGPRLAQAHRVRSPRSVVKSLPHSLNMAGPGPAAAPAPPPPPHGAVPAALVGGGGGGGGAAAALALAAQVECGMGRRDLARAQTVKFERSNLTGHHTLSSYSSGGGGGGGDMLLLPAIAPAHVRSSPAPRRRMSAAEPLYTAGAGGCDGGGGERWRYWGKVLLAKPPAAPPPAEKCRRQGRVERLGPAPAAGEDGKVIK